MELVATVGNHDSKHQFRHIELQIGNRLQRFLMDNGARVSVLTRKLVDSLLPRPTIAPTENRRLVTFTQTPIQVDGVVNLPVKYGSVFVHAFESSIGGAVFRPL